MIVKDQKQALVKQEGDVCTDSMEMSLDIESSQFIMQILSKNLYSDSIGSTVRETVSNALDSHRKAGVDEPVIVSLKRKSHGAEFTVEDFGIGLDGDDVRNIISKYGKSTKRDSDYELGLYGLGFKSPLSYCSSFHFRVRKDGIERIYMMYEGEEMNTIDLLSEESTGERDGTKITVPVKHGDWLDFISKMKEQLAYFTNVYFDIDYGTGIDNNFSIFRTEHFQKSEISEDGKLHMSLDDVYYPLDFSKLGIDQIYVPIALRFGLNDGIYPTPNREAIRYTKETIDIILTKIEKVADYFVEKYNSSNTEGLSTKDDIMKSLKQYADGKIYYQIDNLKYEISSLVKYSSIPLQSPKVKGTSLIDIKELSKNYRKLFEEYHIKYSIRNGRMRSEKYNELYPHNITDNKIYTYSEKIPKIKKDYIKSINNRYGVKFIRKTKPFYLFPKYSYDDCYHRILNLKNHPKKEWRQRIKEFQHILNIIIESFENVDDMIVPKEWIERQKDIKRSRRNYPSGNNSGRKSWKMKGEIVGKMATPLLKNIKDRECKFESWKCKVKDVHKAKGLIVYDSRDNEKRLEKLYPIFGRQKVYFLSLSERELKIAKKIESHNLISYKEFMKGKTMPFKRVVTAHLISELYDEYRQVFDKRSLIRKLSEKFNIQLKILKDYESDNYNNSMVADVVDVSVNNNLFDYRIHHTYLKVKSILEKMPFIHTVITDVSWGNDGRKFPMIDVLRDMFKYHKFRMDYKNYKLPEKEELLTN